LKKPVYIGIEGIDGAGKTTQAKLLHKMFLKKRIQAVLIHEPSKNEVGKIIRNALKKKVDFSEEAMALLFAADRLVLRREIIEPSLKRNISLISDRTVYSSLAYQSASTKRRKWVEEINKFAAEPDIVVFIDISSEEAVKRLKHLKQRYEKLEFLKKVRKEYLRILKRHPKVVKVDGSKPVQQVRAEIVEKLKRFIPELKK